MVLQIRQTFCDEISGIVYATNTCMLKETKLPYNRELKPQSVRNKYSIIFKFQDLFSLIFGVRISPK